MELDLLHGKTFNWERGRERDRERERMSAVVKVKSLVAAMISCSSKQIRHSLEYCTKLAQG